MTWRELQPSTPRRSMTKQRAARILARQDQRCAACGCDLGAPGTRYEIDHSLSLHMGGTDDDDNLSALCIADHRKKSRADAKASGKLRRQIAMADTVRQSRIPSRGFDGRPIFRTGQ